MGSALSLSTIVDFCLNLGLSFRMHRYFFSLLDGHIHNKSIVVRIQLNYNKIFYVKNLNSLGDR